MIRRRFACEVRESTAVESAPWGFVSENRFLNEGVAFTTDKGSHDVLRVLHDIELDMGCGTHRNPDGSYADRLIDIDIVAIDEMMIDTPELVVPHPRMAERDFVLAPMAELAPQWRHPVLHKSAAELLAQMSSDERGRDECGL